MNNYDLAGMKAKQDTFDARAAALLGLVDAFVVGFTAELDVFVDAAQSTGLRGIRKVTMRPAATDPARSVGSGQGWQPRRPCH